MLHYIAKEPENITKDTPLLVLLHGYGSHEEDLFSFAPSLPEDWLTVSFRAPLQTPYGGFCWFDIRFDDQKKWIDENQAKESIFKIEDSIKEIKTKYEIEGKTKLCGFSQGGMLSYALSLKNPQNYDKIACLSAYPEMKIIQEPLPKKKDLEHLRFFISHGTDDVIIPMEMAIKGADLLYELSAYFSFREYMNGHGINEKNFIDLMDFFQK